MRNLFIVKNNHFIFSSVVVISIRKRSSPLSEPPNRDISLATWVTARRGSGDVRRFRRSGGLVAVLTGTLYLLPGAFNLVCNERHFFTTDRMVREN